MSGDLISRQAVLDLIRSLTRWCVRSESGKSSNVGLLYDDVMFGIDKLPPVTLQEPKTGHWIEIAQYSDGNHKIECSECGSHIFDRGHANSFNVKNKYKYCPNCGARMEGSDTE